MFWTILIAILLLPVLARVIAKNNKSQMKAREASEPRTETPVKEQPMQEKEAALAPAEPSPSPVEATPGPTAPAHAQPNSRQLFVDTLLKIGCQYEIDDDGRILFAYQGERFVVGASNDHAYVSIWDYCWKSVELDDIDEIARLRKCINEANLNCTVKTVFTIDNEGNTMDVHCHAVILFIPEIPNIDDYMRLELNEFFRAHQTVDTELIKLREKESN
jgi:hypothetical protein